MRGEGRVGGGGGAVRPDRLGQISGLSGGQLAFGSPGRTRTVGLEKKIKESIHVAL